MGQLTVANIALCVRVELEESAERILLLGGGVERERNPGPGQWLYSSRSREFRWRIAGRPRRAG